MGRTRATSIRKAGQKIVIRENETNDEVYLQPFAHLSHDISPKPSHLLSPLLFTQKSPLLRLEGFIDVIHKEPKRDHRHERKIRAWSRAPRAAIPLPDHTLPGGS